MRYVVICGTLEFPCRLYVTAQTLHNALCDLGYDARLEEVAFA